MAVPFASVTDLLNLSTTNFECIGGTGPNPSGDLATIYNTDGHFLQEDTRANKLEYTREYHIQNSAATLPTRGKVTGAGSVVYFIDSVQVNKPARGHWSMTVTFHTYADVDSTTGQVTRSALGLSGS